MIRSTLNFPEFSSNLKFILPENVEFGTADNSELNPKLSPDGKIKLSPVYES